MPILTLITRDSWLMITQDDPPSPPKRPIVHAARKDADAHFQFTDESSPAVGRLKSVQLQKGSNLYHDPVSENFEDEPIKKPFRDTATHVDNTRRGKDFGAHYTMTDIQLQTEKDRPTSRGTRSDMDQHWSFDTPPAERQIYKTSGDGMGSRKGANVEEQTAKQYKTVGDGM